MCVSAVAARFRETAIAPKVAAIAVGDPRPLAPGNTPSKLVICRQQCMHTHTHTYTHTDGYRQTGKKRKQKNKLSKIGDRFLHAESLSTVHSIQERVHDRKESHGVIIDEQRVNK